MDACHARVKAYFVGEVCELVPFVFDAGHAIPFVHVVYVAAVALLVNISLALHLSPGSQQLRIMPNILLAERYVFQRNSFDPAAAQFLVVFAVGPDDLHHVFAIPLDPHLLVILELFALFEILCAQGLVVIRYAHA